MTKNLGGNALAKAMTKISTGVSDEKIRFPVLGTIDGKLNLMLDGFSKSIPNSDYYLYKPQVKLIAQTGEILHESSCNALDLEYLVELILKPNDRVLCIPIEDGHTFVVIGHV
ncbi:hypothetical protein ACQKMV_05280 [Lysinibacillus sp. NPDC094403]|uniref:hypothetical protein n=1 Tax=Lysinibacillus sp. NPDC094403 TaxID=3390581 RepID=UPI003D078780